jgi:hypothetical protein
MERSEETLPAQVAIKSVRIGLAESLRFPEEGSSAQGQSVPKPRPIGVGDGKQVNIPAPAEERLYDGVTQKDRQSGRVDVAGGDVGGPFRQIRRAITPRVARKCGFGQANLPIPCCREKPLRSSSADRTANRHR